MERQINGDRLYGKAWCKFTRLCYAVKLAVANEHSMLYAISTGHKERIFGWLKKEFPNVKFELVEHGIAINRDKKGKL